VLVLHGERGAGGTAAETVILPVDSWEGPRLALPDDDDAVAAIVLRALIVATERDDEALARRLDRSGRGLVTADVVALWRRATRRGPFPSGPTWVTLFRLAGAGAVTVLQSLPLDR